MEFGGSELGEDPSKGEAPTDDVHEIEDQGAKDFCSLGGGVREFDSDGFHPEDDSVEKTSEVRLLWRGFGRGGEVRLHFNLLLICGIFSTRRGRDLRGGVPGTSRRDFFITRLSSLGMNI